MLKMKTKKNLPSTRSLIGLNLMIFFISDIQGGMGPFLSIYLKANLGLDTSQVGIALATLTFAGTLFQIPNGMLVDASRFKRLLVAIACSFIVVSCFIILTQSSLLPIMIAQSLMGIASSLIPPSVAAITLGLVGPALFPRRVSINETLIHAGTVTTIIITGVLAQLFGHKWIVYVAIIFALLTFIPLLLINPGEINHNVARELNITTMKSKTHVDKPYSILKIFKLNSILFFYCAVIVFHIANAAQLPLVGQELAKINPDSDSIFMASCIVIAQAIMIIVAFSLGFFIKKVNRKPIFLFGFLTVILRAVLFSITDNSYYLLAIQVLDGIGAGIFGVISVVMVSDLAKGTGRFNFMMGVLGLCVGIGASISNVTGGFITKIYCYYIGFISLASIAIIGILLFWFLLPETKGFKERNNK